MKVISKYTGVFFSLLSAFTFWGCRIDDLYIDPNEKVEEDMDVIAWTITQNQWIYSQMKYHYLWNEELKDSIEYDYLLEPASFFESMKVPQDRFSYCVYNDNYIASKGKDLNESVPNDSVYVKDGKKIGYFCYSNFAAETDLTDIILLMKGVDELIIDLRGNPGGLVETCVQLASYLVPENALGKVFCRLQYNKTVSEARQKSYGTPYSYYYLKNDVTTRKRNLDLTRVFFLINGRSASCSELLVNCVRPFMPVIVIGETSLGKDVGMYSISSRQYKYTLEPITFRSYNADNVPVPETGLVPDFEITDAAYTVDGVIVDPAMEVAFKYITDNNDNKTSTK